MFVYNRTKNELPNDEVGITYGGYQFFLPVGVSAIWDEAGKHITEHLYKIETKTGFDPFTNKADSAPLPPVTIADRKVWDGKTYARVKRWKLEGERAEKIASGNISRILELAEERGVDENLIRKWRYQPDIDVQEVAKAIDALPIPDEILKPEVKGQASEEEKKEEKEEQEINKEVETIIKQ